MRETKRAIPWQVTRTNLYDLSINNDTYRTSRSGWRGVRQSSLEKSGGLATQDCSGTGNSWLSAFKRKVIIYINTSRAIVAGAGMVGGFLREGRRRGASGPSCETSDRVGLGLGAHHSALRIGRMGCAGTATVVHELPRTGFAAPWKELAVCGCVEGAR